MPRDRVDLSFHLGHVRRDRDNALALFQPNCAPNKRPVGACKDKDHRSRPPVGLSGTGHREPLTTDHRPDISATSSIRVPYLRRQASSRLHALFPKMLYEPWRHSSSGYGVALSILACSAAPDISCRGLSTLLPARPPAAIVPVCMHALVAMQACLTACAACSACPPPNT